MQGMDDFSLFIIVNIYNAQLEKRKIELWQIVKKYNWLDLNSSSTPVEQTYYYTKKYTKAVNILRDMENKGWIKIDKIDNGKVYSIVEDKLKIEEHQFSKGKKGKKLALKILQNNNKIVIYEL